jgi:hypothetical protein
MTKLAGGVLSERKSPGPWDDCTLCSAGMLAQHAGGVRRSRASIRIASGVYDRSGISDPTTLEHAERAIHKLWPSIKIERATVDWVTLVRKLRNGYGAVVQGRQGVLDAHLRRWDPGYTGGHACFVCDGLADTVLWYDPLAVEGYAGERVSWVTLHKWMLGLSSKHLFTIQAKGK